MVECLMEGNRTSDPPNCSSRVKVLTSVSRINIGANKSMEVEDETRKKISGRIFSKSFKNITLNNTIGVSRKNSMQLKAFAMSFHGGASEVALKGTVDICSRKNMTKDFASSTADQVQSVATPKSENPKKELYRKVKLHSTSVGFRSPLKQRG